MARVVKWVVSAGLSLATTGFVIRGVAHAVPALGLEPPATTAPTTAAAAPAPAAVTPTTVTSTPAPGVVTASTPSAEGVSTERGSPAVEPATLEDGSFGAFQRHSFVSAGFRSSLVKSEGFDPYAGSDVLTYVALAAGRTVFVEGPLSVVAGIGLDIAGRGDTARGADTSLSVVRVGLVPELRYHLLKRGFLFGRLGLGVARVSSSLEDPVTDREWESKHTTFSADLGAGFAYAVASSRSMRVKSPRLWLLAEGGALYVPTLSQKLSNTHGVPARSADLALPDLALLSPYYRVAVMLSF